MIFDYEAKKTDPEASNRFQRLVELHEIEMICMQRRNYQHTCLRALLDTEWRREILPELHSLLEQCRARTTEEMIERGANLVLRQATEGHHDPALFQRNARVAFALKSDPNSLLNTISAHAYPRLSAPFSATWLTKCVEFLVQIIKEVFDSPVPKQEPTKARTKKELKNEPQIKFAFAIFNPPREENKEKIKKTTKTPGTSEALPLADQVIKDVPNPERPCDNPLGEENEKKTKKTTKILVTSEALPLAYQVIKDVPNPERPCDIATCKGEWKTTTISRLSCGHFVHTECLQANRRCSCHQFIQRKVYQLHEDFSTALVAGNTTDNGANKDKDDGDDGLLEENGLDLTTAVSNAMSDDDIKKRREKCTATLTDLKGRLAPKKGPPGAGQEKG